MGVVAGVAVVAAAVVVGPLMPLLLPARPLPLLPRRCLPDDVVVVTVDIAAIGFICVVLELFDVITVLAIAAVEVLVVCCRYVFLTSSGPVGSHQDCSDKQRP